MASKSNKKNIGKGIIILLVIIILIGGFLRFYHIEKRGLWYDELGSLKFASKNFKSMIISIAQDRHAPLYYLIHFVWIRIFGDSELALRSHSAIFGILCILVIFNIGKELFNSKVGLISSFLLSINIIHIIFSQEAKMYSLLLSLSLLSTYFFIMLLKEGKSRNTIFFIITTSLMLYTHNLAFFILIFQGIYLLFTKKNIVSKTKIFISQLIAALMFLPWVVFLLRTKNLSSTIISIGFSNCSILDKLYSFSAGSLLIKARIFEMASNQSLIGFCFNHNFFDLFYLGKAEFYIFCIYFIFAVVSIIYIIKNFYHDDKNKINILWLILLWLLIPLILKCLIVLSGPRNWGIRFNLFSLPPFLLLIATGINSLKKRIFKIAIITLIIALSLVVFYKYDTLYSQSTYVGPYWQLGQFIPENSTNKEIAKYISFNSEPNLFPYIKIQKDAFEYINKDHPNAIVLTDWITAFKVSSPIHGWVKKPLTTLYTNLDIDELSSNEFDLILKITGDGFDYGKSDLVDKALNNFNIFLIKRWKYYNMSVEIYKNNEK